MVDETGQVSPEIMKQTLDLLHFAAERLGKEKKEMAVTFVTNERSHQLNLKYRDTDRPTDVISLSTSQKLPSPLRRIWQTIRSWRRCWTSLTATSASFLSLSIRPRSRRQSTDTPLSGRWAFLQYMASFTSTAMTTIRLRKRRKCLPYRKRC